MSLKGDYSKLKAFTRVGEGKHQRHAVFSLLIHPMSGMTISTKYCMHNQYFVIHSLSLQTQSRRIYHRAMKNSSRHPESM